MVLAIMPFICTAARQRSWSRSLRVCPDSMILSPMATWMVLMAEICTILGVCGHCREISVNFVKCTYLRILSDCQEDCSQNLLAVDPICTMLLSLQCSSMDQMQSMSLWPMMSSATWRMRVCLRSKCKMGRFSWKPSTKLSKFSFFFDHFGIYFFLVCFIFFV